LKSGEEKYHIILSHEKKAAHQIALQLIEKPEVSFWMFLIPLVFIPYLQRLNKYKSAVKIFKDGYLFTKHQALEAAYAMYKEQIPKNVALERAKKTVIKDAKAPEHIQKIYASQLAEISLLVDFYYSLFQTSGNSYEEMIRELHPQKALHLEFLNILAAAEHEVNSRAVHAVKIKETEQQEFLQELEKRSQEFRLQETEKIYC